MPEAKFCPFCAARAGGEASKRVLLMRDKDIEARNNLSQGNRAIVFPFLNGLNVVDKNDEVVFFPVVVDFNLGDIAAGHDYLLLISFWRKVGKV